MKYCSNCKQEKVLREFRPTYKRGRDTLRAECRACEAKYRQTVQYRKKAAIRANEYRKRYPDRIKTYRKSPRGAALIRWDGMNRRCNNSPYYVNVEIKMSKEEFMTWAVPEIDKFIKKNPLDIPSIDRIDLDGHYELNNIRVISKKLNAIRSRFFTSIMGVDKHSSKDEKLQCIRQIMGALCEVLGVSEVILGDNYIKYQK